MVPTGSQQGWLVSCEQAMQRMLCAMTFSQIQAVVTSQGQGSQCFSGAVRGDKGTIAYAGLVFQGTPELPRNPQLPGKLGLAHILQAD